MLFGKQDSSDDQIPHTVRVPRTPPQPKMLVSIITILQKNVKEVLLQFQRLIPESASCSKDNLVLGTKQLICPWTRLISPMMAECCIANENRDNEIFDIINGENVSIWYVSSETSPCNPLKLYSQKNWGNETLIHKIQEGSIEIQRGGREQNLKWL